MANIQFLRCPTCSQRHELDDRTLREDAGSTLVCKCGRTLRVPGGDAPTYARPDESAGPSRPVTWPPVRDGDRLVMMVDRATFPKRCAVCGDDVSTTRSVILRFQGVYEGPPLPGWLRGLVVLGQTKRLQLDVGRCARHSRRVEPSTVSATFGIAGMALLLVGLSSVVWARQPYAVFPLLVGAGFASALIASIGAIWPSNLRVTKIDGDLAWVRGFGQGFLDRLSDDDDPVP